MSRAESAPSRTIPVAAAAFAWFVSWFLGNLLGALVVGASGRKVSEADTPVWLTATVALALWVPMLVTMHEVCVRRTGRSFVPALHLSFRPIDLVGLPIGVATQLLVLPLVYWPLGHVWPSTFGRSRLEQTARTLTDSVHGAGMVLLVLVVVVGAPLVEELVYRGLLQRAVVARVGRASGVVLVALWFAAIHLRPVETPGLLAVGLVLGVCALVADRLGPSVLAHLAFNATGLVLVARR
jgi:membrane protease YdiL (CAAX protease family)